MNEYDRTPADQERADRDERSRMPLPSEDSGDLVAEPVAGQTDDHLVATEEGVPYVPPTERVLATSADEAGAEVVTPRDDAGELERDDPFQGKQSLPRDDALLADVVEALRSSDVVAGDRLRVSVTGTTVTIGGEVESVDVLDEILGIAADVEGVGEVRDEVQVTGI